MKVYIDLRDWWVGYYRGDTHHYVCPLPTLVVRWARQPRADMCCAWDGCTLPAGHNMGQVDVPGNHSVPGRSRPADLATKPTKFYP